MNRPGTLEVIGASAGSGKTTQLTRTVCDAVDPARDDALPLAALVGVTFTTRAADELASRVRQALLSAGAVRHAQELPLARLGTVHAVAFKLLEEFAVDAGLVPGVEVLADGKELQLKRIIEASATAELRARMGGLTRSLEVDWDHQTRQSHWLHNVYKVVDLVRANRIAPAELPAMGRRSADELLALLPKPTRARLDDQLEAALTRAIVDLDDAIADGDGTGASKGARRTLRSARAALAGGRFTWVDWVKLATISPAKKSADRVEALVRVASRYDEHPRFQDDLRDMVEGVYLTAATALEAYATWKQERGVVDYVDMLDRALDLLDVPSVREELAGEIRLAVVDEFQDTSPLQLALFVKLHQLAGTSVWVGDRKQCIFEFAGADPQLMAQVLTWAQQQGGTTRQLGTNYRSRPDLVRFCSTLFSRALAAHGYSADEVTVAPHRSDPPELSKLPAFGIWNLEASNNAKAAEALAAGVADIVAAPDATPVVDRTTGVVRPLRPGDVAVLVRSNEEARTLAGCLAVHGVRVAMARPGLMATPEGRLVGAAVAHVVRPRDSLAQATLDALHGWNGLDPDTWLEAIIVEHRAIVAAREARANGDAPAEIDHPSRPWKEALAPVRDAAHTLAPTEAVDAIVNALNATLLCARWPAPDQRLANLDALRALAAEYETLCESEGTACTLVGLLHYFGTASEKVFDGDEMAANDDQTFTEDPGAVVLVTYHKAKGLEWPVVVLGSLEKGPRDDAFGIHLDSDRATFDPDAPLAGRRIRYWPRPFGNRTKGVPLLAAAEATDHGRHAVLREREERARLLYVGMTRARDHLVFATRGATTWLDELGDADGPLVTLGDRHVAVRGLKRPFPARVRDFSTGTAAEAPEPEDAPRSVFATMVDATPSSAPPLRVAPSSAADLWPDVPRPTMDQLVRLGAPLTVRASKHLAWDAFGTALHGVFAADAPGLGPDERQARAARLLAPLGEPPPLTPDAALLLSDRLMTHLQATYPGAIWRREVPIDTLVAAPDGPRRIAGTIDLLLELPDALVLIDHKSLPNPTERHLRDAAAAHAPQLGAYLAALAAASPKPVTAWWVHFPVGGVMVGGRT